MDHLDRRTKEEELDIGSGFSKMKGKDLGALMSQNYWPLKERRFKKEVTYETLSGGYRVLDGLKVTFIPQMEFVK